MKKILSAMLAFTVIISLCNVTGIASDTEFSTIKHTWVTGTVGTITASSNSEDISYESSNPNILTVENNGTFTAVSEGTASVIPYVNGVQQTPVEITVFPSGIVSQNVVDDINTGKLIIDAYGTPVKDKNKGSKLFSLLYETGALYYDGSAPGMGVQTEGVDNGSYMTFLYKLDETPENVKASFYKYGTDDVIKDRVSFGFLTDETTVAGTVLADNNLNQYGVRQALIAGPPEGSDSSKWVYRLTDDWNCIKDISWNLGLPGYDNSNRLHEGSISSIPSNAKYMAVFVNLGLAENGKIMKEEGAGESVAHIRYIGADIIYPTKLLAAELTSDNRIALTFNNTPERTPRINVTVDGVSKTASTVLDSASKTVYIGGFKPEDEVTIETDYGTYSFTIPGKNLGTVYVSPSGNDSNDGSKTSPLATLEGARDKVRAIKNSGYTGAVEVLFDAGIYRFDKGVNFTSADSGTVGQPVTYRAKEGADVRFSGAMSLDMSKAKAVTDESIRARLRDEVKDKVVVLDLAEQGVARMDDEELNEALQRLYVKNYEHLMLFADNEEQMLAQWPNGDGNYAYYDYDTSGGAVSPDSIIWKAENTEPSRWSEAKAMDWWIGGYVYDYAYLRFPGLSVEPGSRRINLKSGAVNIDDAHAANSNYVNHRWKAFNLLEEIDSPTEWYVDKENMLLYYYPAGNSSNAAMELAVLKDDIITLKGTEYVMFEGITFEKTRDMAISGDQIKGINITDCTFENIGSSGFAVEGTKKAECNKEFWQYQYADSAYDCNITNCKFNNIGGFGVVIDGGNIDTLTKGNNKVENCIFYRCSQKIRAYETIRILGCGNIVTHNNISASPFGAIRSYGNDHEISYNEIHDVIRECDDEGAIYQGRNAIQRGTVIKYNYIHDLISKYTPDFGHKPAIYWDDYQTGMTAEHNIIVNTYGNVYTNGLDHKFNYNTSVNISAFNKDGRSNNLDFCDGGVASNKDDGGDSTEYDLKKAFPTDEMKALYYEKYPNLQKMLECATGLKVNPTTTGTNATRQLFELTEIKNNINVAIGSGYDTGNAIGDYTMYPNATYKKKYSFFGDIVLDQNKSPNANISNDDNHSANFVDITKQDYRLNEDGDCSASPLNRSFDIEQIGVQTDISTDAMKTEAVSPQNSETINGSKNVDFIWKSVFGATEYVVEVAADESFSNIIASDTVYTPYARLDLSGTESGTKCWWRVTASNTSREFFQSEVSSMGMFTLGKRIDVKLSVSGNSVSFEITNNGYKDGKEACIYLAGYDSNESLAAVYGWNKTLAYETAPGFKVENMTMTGENIEYIKLFVWDLLNRPLSEAEIYRITK